MNKKLNITAAEYQHKVRQQAKARTKRFREEQERRGYKNLTVYLSEKFRAELKRLSDEKGLNRQAAMDHIFGIYQQTAKSGVTNNATIDNDKNAETPVNPKSLATEPNQSEKIQDQEPVETQTESPGPIPDKKVFDRESTLKVMDQGYNDGEKWDAIAAELNDLGLLTARGKHWTEANAQIFYSRNRNKD